MGIGQARELVARHRHRVPAPGGQEVRQRCRRHGSDAPDTACLYRPMRTRLLQQAAADDHGDRAFQLQRRSRRLVSGDLLGKRGYQHVACRVIERRVRLSFLHPRLCS